MDRATPLAVFVNPFAGGGSARKAAEARARFAQRKFPATFHQPRTAGEYSAAVRAAVAGGACAVAALGGDGTLQRLVQEVLGCPVRVGILPAGGGNDFAAALGLTSLARAVEAIVAGRSRPVDVVRVRGPFAGERIYLGGGGTGLDSRAAEFAGGSLSKLPGRLRYLASALLALARFRGAAVEVEFPGSTLGGLRRDALLAAVLNAPSYGGGLRLAPEAKIDDGLLDLVVIERLTKLELLGLLPGLLLAGRLSSPRVVRRQAGKIRLAAEGEGLHGDGEWFGRGPFEIEVLPKAVEMLAP
jgi:diacylglycerol kinase (ATP)